MQNLKKVILKIVISSALLAFLFYKVEPESLLVHIKTLNVRYIPLILLFLVINYYISSIRWKALLIFKNCEKASIKYLTSLYFKGAFFNNFMPTSIGGDDYKVDRLGKRIDSTANAFSATFMERFTGMIALGFISIASLIGLLGLWGALLFIGFIVGIFMGYYVLSFLSHKSEKIKKIYDSLNAYRNQRKILFWAFMTSFVVQLISILTQYFVFLALGIELPFFYAMFVFPVITLAGVFIPSLNGLGVQDVLYVKLFAYVGVANPLSLSASIIYHLCRLGISLIGGLLYVVGKED